MHGRLKNLYKTLFWVSFAAITVASLAPRSFSPGIRVSSETVLRTDYSIHFVSYMVMAAFLVFWKLPAEKTKITLKMIFLFGAASSSVFEFIQIYIPTRTYNPFDILYNFLGFLAGAVLFGGIVLKRESSGSDY